VVVDRTAAASGATAKSFGWINAAFAETEAYFQLRLAAMQAWRDLDIPMTAPVRWKGALGCEVEGDALTRQAMALRARGYPVEMLDRAAFAHLEPEVANPPSQAMLWSAEGAVDPAAATESLLSAAAALGAERLFGCEVLGIQRNGTRVTGVETSFGQLSGDTIVVAAGVAGEGLVASLGVRLPMENKVGLIVQTLPVRPAIEHIILSPEIHFRQERDGRLVAGEIFSGGGAHAGMIARDPRALAAVILEKLRHRLPGVEGIALGSLMLGLRPTPVDGLPVIGTPRGVEGLYLAAMHSGITLGPLIGSLIAAEVTGNPVSMLESFRPDRFN
jgi:glycine/D-amino acid oxidase-like deaminating enzyme